jgi:D-sedoheptulose 7-phosphate isomerase
MIKPFLAKSIADLSSLLSQAESYAPQLQRLADTMLECFGRRGKALICGNGGSAADAMHFAEELSVRFCKNRRALPALALLDASVLTCAANDFGYNAVFSRQVEALGNPGDILIALTTSGDSPSVVAAVDAARAGGLVTCAFLGKDGGKLRGVCDIELLVPHNDTARVQEIHKLLFHTVCAWLDSKID